jgi:hypothetical protein
MKREDEMKPVNNNRFDDLFSFSMLIVITLTMMILFDHRPTGLLSSKEKFDVGVEMLAILIVYLGLAISMKPKSD